MNPQLRSKLQQYTKGLAGGLFSVHADQYWQTTLLIIGIKPDKDPVTKLPLTLVDAGPERPENPESEVLRKHKNTKQATELGGGGRILIPHM